VENKGKKIEIPKRVKTIGFWEHCKLTSALGSGNIVNLQVHWVLEKFLCFEVCYTLGNALEKSTTRVWKDDLHMQHCQF